MGCIPSKNSKQHIAQLLSPLDNDPEVTTSLLSSEVQENRNPHPVQSYDLPSRYIYDL